jgi:hypothetical protein
MKSRLLTFALFASLACSTGCLVDDSRVEYNTYKIGTISPQVDSESATVDGKTQTVKKVHVGHDFPINIELDAKYADSDVPLQYYLLNVDDVEEVEKGIGSESDIRTYYCERSTLTTIKSMKSGASTYGSVISIPADSAIDSLTGHYKTGVYYIVADANKYDNAEPDAMEIYRRSKDKLDENNKIMITTDFINLPDLSVEDMNFTGGSSDPKDVVVFYNINLANLPGGKQANAKNIYLKPTEEHRYFSGTVSVKSSSCDSLNVPIKFTLQGTNSAGTTIEIPLKVYDEELKAFQSIYYIPLLKANVAETLSLGLQIPDDSGTKNWFDDWDGFVTKYPVVTQAVADLYPLSAMRHLMSQSPSDGEEYFTFKIVANVNPSGSVKESRFVVPKDDDSTYTSSSYIKDGGTSATTTTDNNKVSQALKVKLEEMEVTTNDGIKQYPYCKLPEASRSDSDKNLVIFWDGYGLNVGNSKFGAAAQMHEGMYFYNYSLYSLGLDITGSLFSNQITLVNTYLNAESHPYNAGVSGYDFHIEAGKKVYLSDAAEGFNEKTFEYPILLSGGQDKSVETQVYFITLKLTAGYEIYFTPGVDVAVKEDGALSISKFAKLQGSVHADASASIGGLATIGLYTYLDVLGLELRQNCYTTTQFNEKKQIMGTLNRDAGLYLKGPSGYINAYFEINFLFITKRWEKQIFSFTSFTVPIFEVDFLGSGLGTTYQDTEDSSLIPDSSILLNRRL